MPTKTTRNLPMKYNCPFFAYVPLTVGRLQTVWRVPTVPEKISVEGGMIIRLARLVRGLPIDCRVDIATFFVPHRHVYSNWETFITEGVDTSQTLASTTLTQSVDSLGSHYDAADTIPDWCLHPYNMIWNRYYKLPFDTDRDVGAQPTGKAARWGIFITKLPSMISGLMDETLTEADYEIADGDWDIRELGRMKGRLKTEIRRDYFGRRYSELMQSSWGSKIGPETDQRPHMIWHEVYWLSGHDVVGTADANLGQVGGASVGTFRYTIPMRNYPEHGSLWTLISLRWPPIHEEEVDYLSTKSSPTYKQIAGDPDIIKHEPPIAINFSDGMHNHGTISSGHTLGKAPYAQWYRYIPSYVHKRYDDLNAYPFLSGHYSTAQQARYHYQGEFDRVFKGAALGHATVDSSWRIQRVSRIPGALTQIFAGTR